MVRVRGQRNLEIPEKFTIPHKAFLKSPMKEFEANWSYTNDILRNIAGFVPVGFLVCAYWGRVRSRWRAILFTILAGAGLSFGIEVLQFYIPQRGSGITDIITNTLGAALGALLARPGIVLAIFEKRIRTGPNCLTVDFLRALWRTELP